MRLTQYDFQRATLFLYLLKHGDPRFSKVSWDGISDEELLVALTGWSDKRAKSALERAVQCGYAERELHDDHVASAGEKGK